MTPGETEKPRMNEPLSSKDTKENVTMRLRVGDCAVEHIKNDRRLFRFDIAPVTSTTEVTTIDDREIEKGRKVFATLNLGLKIFNGDQPLDAKVPTKFGEEAKIDCANNTCSESGKHAC